MADRPPPRPTLYPEVPPTPEPSKGWVLFWARFVPSTILGAMICGVILFAPLFVGGWSLVGGSIVRSLARTLNNLTRSLGPIAVFGLWVGMSMAFGALVTFFPRRRDGWGRVREGRPWWWV